MLVAGEETNESLSTWPRAAAAQQSSESERVARERETERGGKRDAADGRRMQVMHRRRKPKNARAFLWAVFPVSLKIYVFSLFFFHSLLIFYSC